MTVRTAPRKSLSATLGPLFVLRRREIQGGEAAACGRAMMGCAGERNCAPAKPANVAKTATVELLIATVHPSIRERAWSQALIPKYTVLRLKVPGAYRISSRTGYPNLLLTWPERLADPSVSAATSLPVFPLEANSVRAASYAPPPTARAKGKLPGRRFRPRGFWSTT